MKKKLLGIWEGGLGFGGDVGVGGVWVVLAVHLEVCVVAYFGDGSGVKFRHEVGVVGGFDGDDVEAGGVVDVVGVHCRTGLLFLRHCVELKF